MLDVREIRLTENELCRKILIINDKLNFIYFEKFDEEQILKAVDYKVDYVVSSDSHGDIEMLTFPLKFDAKKYIYLGDYYPYVSEYIKYRCKDRSLKHEIMFLVHSLSQQVDAELEKLKLNPKVILLYGNHDKPEFPISYELNINDCKITFQHSLIVKNVPPSEIPTFTLLQPNEDLDIPKSDYIIVGHLKDYSQLGISNLYTVDCDNSCYIRYQYSVIRKCKYLHYKSTIPKIKELIEKYKAKGSIKLQLENEEVVRRHQAFIDSYEKYFME